MVPLSLSWFVLLAHGETDLCSTEPEVRESNGDELTGAAAAVQDAESSADSGVDEKVSCACLELHLCHGFFLITP